MANQIAQIDSQGAIVLRLSKADMSLVMECLEAREVELRETYEDENEDASAVIARLSKILHALEEAK